MLIKKLKYLGMLLLVLVSVACFADKIESSVPNIAVTPSMVEIPLTLHPTSTPSFKGVFPSGWTTYTDGNNITDLAFDQSGFLWASGIGGVTQWNLSNRTYKRYTASNGLPSNNVTAIHAAQDGKVWIGTQHGQIASFNGERWIHYQFPELSLRMPITDIYQDRKGNIWFTTYGAGVISFDGKNWKVNMLDDGMASVAVNGIAEDRKGNLWFETYIPCCDSLDGKNIQASFGEKNGMKFGITRYRNGTWSIFSQEFGIDDCCTVSHLTTTSTELWVAPCNPGELRDICSYDGSQVLHYKTPDKMNLYIQRIVADDENNVWFIPYRGGVLKFDRQNWYQYTEANGLLDNEVTSALVGSDGKMWFGTARGISSFDGKNWFSYVTSDPESTLPSMNISDLAVGPDNVLWLATTSGIVRFDGKDWQVIDTDSGLPNSNDVRSIAITKENQIWAGIVYWPPDSQGDQSSVAFYDGAWWKNFENVRGAEEIRIANDDSVWFNSFGSIYKYHQGQWDEIVSDDLSASQFLLSSNSSPWFIGSRGSSKPTVQSGLFHWEDNKWILTYQEHVERMALAPDGSLWLAQIIYEETGDHSSAFRPVGVGFRKFDGIHWNLQFTLAGKSGLSGKDMIFSTDGSLWVCPYVSGEGEDGLYRYSDDNWSHFTIQDGLSGNSVKAIYLASDGAFWFITEGGLTRYDNLNK